MGTELNRAVVSAVSRGGRVESRTDDQAVIVYGRPINHAMHAILFVFTCSLWGIVWLIMAVGASERRQVLSVDGRGRLMVDGWQPRWQKSLAL